MLDRRHVELHLLITGKGRQYKSSRVSSNSGNGGVGILLVEKWIEKVVDVNRFDVYNHQKCHIWTMIHYCLGAETLRREKFYIDRFAKVYACKIFQFFLFFSKLVGCP